MTASGEPAVDPVLVEVRRGSLLESVHRGRFVLLGPDGGIDVVAGAAGTVLDAAVYARSALKPIQAVTLVAAGFGSGAPGDDSRAVAMACASHDGEPMHLAAVRDTLRAAGLAEPALQCPADLPADRDALVTYLEIATAPARICHNCSGKHAAMLATCARRGWSTADYLAPDHPLQQAILATVRDRCGVVIESSVDGCGAPAHAVTLPGLARAFAALARGATVGASSRGRGADDASSGGRGADDAGAAVAHAMRRHPWLVGGSRRAVSALMADVDGLIAKDGADGVWAAALPDGRAFAAKIDDGAARALPPLLATVLRAWGVDSPVVRSWSATPVLGGGRPVGAVAASPVLRDLLGLPPT